MRLSFWVATLGWISTFWLAWLVIFNKVPSTSTTWVFFGFFTIVAFVASVVSAMPPKPPKP